jgi:glucokinase
LPKPAPSHARSIVGLDVGGSKIACVEGTAAGRILAREVLETRPQVPFETTFPDLVALVQRRIDAARQAGRQVVAVSVSIGGPLRIASGRLLDPPHLPGWHHVRLKARLARALPSLPVYVEHDGNAGALAEFRFGAGAARRGLRHLVFLTFGTGLGAGFVLNGRILRGASDTAGEVGHWRLAPDGPVGFGKAGSWEGFASGAGLVGLAHARYPGRWPAAMTVRELVSDMLADDPEALAVATEAGTRLGAGLALLIDALNPELIVIGTLAVVLGERVLGPARRVVAAEALPTAVAACEIVPAALGRAIGDVASLMAVLGRPAVRRRLFGQ